MSGLVERLLKQAQSASEASKMMAQAKSLRQDHNPPRDDLYAWATPEQTLEAQAAARITALEAEVERLRGLVGDIADIAFTAPELNPSNYDHDQVCELNNAMNQIASFIPDGVRQALGGPHDAD